MTSEEKETITGSASDYAPTEDSSESEQETVGTDNSGIEQAMDEVGHVKIENEQGNEVSVDQAGNISVMENTQNTAPKSKNIAAIIVSVLVLLAVVGGGSFYFMRKRRR